MTSCVETVVGIYVFDGVELLDMAGPYEVFTTAARVAARTAAGDRFRVLTVGRSAGPYLARAGLRLEADCPLTHHPRLDILIVPGGVVDAEVANGTVREWLATQAGHVPLIASVCTGAFLLGAAGLLRGRRATTHWEDIEALARACPDTVVMPGVRWVDEGDVVTSAGISAGIDMALHLVARTAGRELARATARQMEYDWRDPD